MRNANDHFDADEMSERLRDGSLKAVFHGAPEMLTLGSSCAATATWSHATRFQVIDGALEIVSLKINGGSEDESEA
jgi:hypothetical protein